jgi:outer membrane protein assembly factor BamB
MIVTGIVLWFIKHESMGPAWLVFYYIPILPVALVVWSVTTLRSTKQVRRIALALIMLIVSGIWALIRTEGIDGNFVATFYCRWTKSSEEKMLTDTENKNIPIHRIEIDINKEAEWSGFRGPDRNGIISGVCIDTDWNTSQPVVLWRKPIGAGWSSFAVHSNFIYTQEQRGENEIVACYNLKNGEPQWYHKDAERFFESNGGAGPRGTPTLNNGRVYALGGTGLFNVLDARDGKVIWSRNVVKDTKTPVPTWGFSGSPLVIDDMVIVAASNSIISYDINSGKPCWSKKYEKEGYSSPHFLNINGIPQVAFINGKGIISFKAATGKTIWKHDWQGEPILQPSITPDGDILISVSETSGIRCLSVTKGPDAWIVKERWTSRKLNPYFNDFVVHKGYIYGFHTRSLACIDVKDGKRKWKGGRYGNGQLVLLADQDLLIIISEKGKVAIVKADPDMFKELGNFQAIEGKTWNHPVLVKDLLLVRNDKEMAVYRLALADNRSS